MLTHIICFTHSMVPADPQLCEVSSRMWSGGLRNLASRCEPVNALHEICHIGCAHCPVTKRSNVYKGVVTAIYLYHATVSVD